MQKIKLVNLLKTFSTQEMKDFKKFISSPYFEHRRNLVPLYNALKKYYPSFDSPNFTEEKVFSIINPGKKYEKKKAHHTLQVLISEMTQLAEKFIAIELLQTAEEGYMVSFALDEALKGRNLMNYRMKIVLNNIETLKKTDVMHIFFYHMFSEYTRLQELFFYTSRIQEALECDRKLNLYMYGSSIQYLSKQVNNYIIYSNIYKSYTGSKKLIEMGINSFDPKIFEKECYNDELNTKQHILATYYIAKSQLNDEDEESLETAVKILKDNYAKFKVTTSYYMIFTILNICTRKMHVNTQKYSLIGSDVSDFANENGIFEQTENSFQNRILYLTIFHLKLKVTSYENFKNFIDIWHKKINSEEYKSVFDYSHAWLEFKNNDYEKTLDHLSKFSAKSPLINNYATMLRIASLFSLGHIEQAIYSLNSYEHYFTGNSKATDLIKREALLFIKSLHTLIKFQTSSNPTDTDMLDKIIEENRNTHFHSWFKEKADELKHKRTS